MYQFPQALSAYIESAQFGAATAKSSGTIAAWLPDHPLNTLLFISLVINLVFVWCTAALYGLIGAVLGDAGVTVRTLAAAGLWGQSLLLLTAFCVVLWQWLAPNSNALAAFIRTLPSYAASYTAAGFVFGKILLNPSPLGSSLWLVGIAVGVVAGAAVRIYLLTRPVLRERTVQQGMLWVAGICAVLVLGMWIEARDVVDGVPGGLFYLYEGILFATMSISLVVLRPDDWVLAQWRGEREPEPDGSWQIPHVTLLPYEPLAREVQEQLRLNWEEGVRNAQRVGEASYQLPYILSKLRQVFSESAESDLVERAEFLVDEFMGNDLLFALAPDTDTPFVQPVRASLSMGDLLGNRSQSRRRQRRSVRRKSLSVELSTDTASRAALAGFWYMHMLYPEKAAPAFERAGRSDEQQEMLALARALEILLPDDIESAQAPLQLPKRPKDVEHKATWDALAKLQTVIRCVWVLQRCFDRHNVDRMARTAIAHLDDVRTDREISASEQSFLQQVAQAWLEDVNEIASEQLTRIQQQRRRDSFKTVKNPFAFAGPLLQNAPVRRKEMLAQIHRAWTMGNLQPLLVYGQSLVGKTSLARSAQQEMEHALETVFVNLRRLSPQASSPQLLQAITSEVADLLALSPPPLDAWQQDEHFVFQSFISQACRMVEPQGLVIILDEFDHIESIMRTPIQRDHILRFLWDLGQAEAQLGFVFITKSTPEELHTQYDNPFSGGLAPVHVRRFTLEETESLLRMPVPDFLPYVLDEAVTQVYELTAGHPYLVQIIGYGLIEAYNQKISNQQLCDPVFDVKDVERVLDTSDLKRRAEFYYQMVLSEVRQGENDCEDLLYALAAERSGMTEESLRESGLDLKCVEKLSQHGLIEQDEGDGRWRIEVEMLRQWLVDNPPP